MLRYTKQFNESSCGPVALLNAIKWAGYVATNKSHLRYYKNLCKYNEGTYSKDLHRALKTVPELKIVKRSRSLTLCKLDKQLDIGNAVILTEHVNWEPGHYVFVSKRTSCFYTVINYYSGKTDTFKTIKRVSRTKMSKLLSQKSMHGDKPEAWFLKAK
jgi:hypothetical protein